LNNPKITIISTFGNLNESRGGRNRLDTLVLLNRQIGSLSVLVPTFFKKNPCTIDGINYFFYNITFTDLWNCFLKILEGSPISQAIFFRNKIQIELSKSNITIFHLIRTYDERYKIPAKGKIYVDICESLSENFKKRASLLPRYSFKRFFYIFEAKRLEKLENKIIKKRNLNFIFITKKDKLFLKCTLASVLPNLNLNNYIKNSTAFGNYFVFIGHVDYEPNYKAIVNFAYILNRLDFNLKFRIIGRCSKKNEKFLSQFKNVSLEGYLDDVSHIISNAIAGVAIIENGTGLQNKVLDYISYGIPALVNLDVKSAFPGNLPCVECKDFDHLQKFLPKLFDKKWRSDFSKKCSIYINQYQSSIKNPFITP